jgi:hypothetical protein
MHCTICLPKQAPLHFIRFTCRVMNDICAAIAHNADKMASPQYTWICCDMRLVQIRNKAAPSELIPSFSIQRNKLISNQLDLLIVYIAVSRTPSPSGCPTAKMQLTYILNEDPKKWSG